MLEVNLHYLSCVLFNDVSIFPSSVMMFFRWSRHYSCLKALCNWSVVSRMPHLHKEDHIRALSCNNPPDLLTLHLCSLVLGWIEDHISTKCQPLLLCTGTHLLLVIQRLNQMWRFCPASSLPPLCRHSCGISHLIQSCASLALLCPSATVPRVRTLCSKFIESKRLCLSQSGLPLVPPHKPVGVSSPASLWRLHLSKLDIPSSCLTDHSVGLYFCFFLSLLPTCLLLLLLLTSQC